MSAFRYILDYKAIVWLSILLLAICFCQPVSASISRNLSSEIRLGYGNTEQDGTRQESVDQEYNLSWQKSIIRGLLVKSSARYYNFGVGESNGANSWRSEFQPYGEIMWSQSWLSMNGQVSRRDSKSNDRLTHLITESVGVSFRSQYLQYPWIKARVQNDELYNQANRADRDTRDRLASASAGYNGRAASIGYSFSYKNTLNRSQQVEQSSNSHVLQFAKTSSMMRDKLRSSLSYSFSYKDETDRNLAHDPFSSELPVFAGLFAEDATPDLGSLDTVTTLVDDNTNLPTLPQIEIGDNHVNRNIGVDLGFIREVSRIYIYTDRPSGNGVRWEVYGSDDNTIWEPIPNASSYFSPGFSRYDISFPQTASRYIKAVNYGLNEVDSVLVTEIEALVESPESGIVHRDQRIHLAGLTNNLLISDAWSASANFSLRRDGGSSLYRRRDETYFVLGLRQVVSKSISQNARVQFGFMDFEGLSANVDRSVSGTYDILYKPLETLDFSLSLVHRDSYIETVKYQEVNQGLVKIRGQVLPRLSVSTEFTGGRNTLNSSVGSIDTWISRTSLEGRVTRRLDATLDYTHQNTSLQDGTSRAKNRYGCAFGYRLTQTIQIRGDVDLSNDNRIRSLTQDYSLSWMITPKLSTGATIYMSDFRNGIRSRSERYSAQLDYTLSNRTVITGSFTNNDLSTAGGGSNQTFRLGLRTGF